MTFQKQQAASVRTRKPRTSSTSELTTIYSVCLTPTDHARLAPNGSHGELSKRIRTLAYVLGHEDAAREYDLILEKLKELSNTH